MKKIFICLLIVVSPLFLSGCDSILAGIGELMCSLAPDSDHCYQWSAVQGSNTETCEKIKGTKFKDTGSNPPRDKCYLQIAINTGNYNTCNKIKGGLMSYTYQECVLDTAIKHDDVTGCKLLKSFPTELSSCRGSLVSVSKVNEKDSQIESIIEKLKSDRNNEELKKKLEEFKKQKEATYNELDDGQKGTYFKDKREKILGDIEEEDVKSIIAKEYTAFRGKNGNMSVDTQLEKLKQIKDEQAEIKKLDEYANELTDTIKGQIEGVVNNKKDEIIDGAKEKAVDYIKEKGGEDMKWGLKNLEYMKNKYEKGSEQYNKLQEKYNKLKGIYDEVMGVYNKVDSINTMVAQGKITEGQAQAIKGGVFIQKGLEHITKYVPVFGSTISKVSTETFEVVIKKAKQRAERNNSLSKCIDDPEHCDPSNITGY